MMRRSRLTVFLSPPTLTQQEADRAIGYTVTARSVVGNVIYTHAGVDEADGTPNELLIGKAKAHSMVNGPLSQIEVDLARWSIEFNNDVD